MKDGERMGDRWSTEGGKCTKERGDKRTHRGAGVDGALERRGASTWIRGAEGIEAGPRGPG
jgi:hypothetical protein